VSRDEISTGELYAKEFERLLMFRSIDVHIDKGYVDLHSVKTMLSFVMFLEECLVEGSVLIKYSYCTRLVTRTKESNMYAN